MAKFILGKKIGMSQGWFDENGKLVPVTLIEAGPCEVLQTKTAEKDGYNSFQIGFDKVKKEKKIKKTMKGKPFRFLKEFKEADLKVGDTLDVSMFQKGDVLKISATSKGKGFQGGVKRHGFSGRNATHGVKHEHRTIGSAGPTYPERVIKGKRMPGRMGSDRITIKSVKVIDIDKDKNLLIVKGAVPGRPGALLEIKAEGDIPKAPTEEPKIEEVKTSSPSATSKEVSEKEEVKEIKD